MALVVEEHDRQAGQPAGARRLEPLERPVQHDLPTFAVERYENHLSRVSPRPGRGRTGSIPILLAPQLDELRKRGVEVRVAGTPEGGRAQTTVVLEETLCDLGDGAVFRRQFLDRVYGGILRRVLRRSAYPAGHVGQQIDGRVDNEVGALGLCLDSQEYGVAHRHPETNQVQEDGVGRVAAAQQVCNRRLPLVVDGAKVAERSPRLAAADAAHGVENQAGTRHHILQEELRILLQARQQALVDETCVARLQLEELIAPLYKRAALVDRHVKARRHVLFGQRAALRFGDRGRRALLGQCRRREGEESQQRRQRRDGQTAAPRCVPLTPQIRHIPHRAPPDFLIGGCPPTGELSSVAHAPCRGAPPSVLLSALSAAQFGQFTHRRAVLVKYAPLRVQWRCRRDRLEKAPLL